jgi:lysozyme
MSNFRVVVAALTLSATAFGGLVMNEGWSDVAEPPVPGDVPTYGFGTTTDEQGRPLKGGEKINPAKAVVRALQDIQRYEGAIKTCVKVPLHQYEYDAYVSLAYNIGSGAFCGSTLVRKLNAQDYSGACSEILRWDRFNGERLRGLSIRRQAEYEQCVGG